MRHTQQCAAQETWSKHYEIFPICRSNLSRNMTYRFPFPPFAAGSTCPISIKPRFMYSRNPCGLNPSSAAACGNGTLLLSSLNFSSSLPDLLICYINILNIFINKIKILRININIARCLFDL